MSVLAGINRVLLVHAHPDDEALSSGRLIAALAGAGVSCLLVTCTRGERGAVMPGVLPPNTGSDELVKRRDLELTAASSILGVLGRAYLGEPPFRAPGLAATRYEDSGMVWVRPGLAGPPPDAGPASLSRGDLVEQAADLAAGIHAWRPQLVVSYDESGGYGHPDHLRAREIARLACRETGVPFAELVSPESGEGWGSGDGARSGGDGIEWVSGQEDSAVIARTVGALACYRTQLAVRGDERRTWLEHVGGQRQDLPGPVGLRLVPPDGLS